MGRIRYIKPGFFTNEDLAELGPWHRLLFIGLWTLADKHGRLEDRPKRIKALLFPWDKVDVHACLGELHSKGFIVRYNGNGVPCISIPKFTLHQRPHPKEADAGLPEPPESLTKTESREITRKDRVIPFNSTTQQAGNGEWGMGNGDLNGNGEGEGRAPSDDGTPARSPDDLAALWNEGTTDPIVPCRELSDKRRVHARARLRERPFEEFGIAVSKVNYSDFCRGINDRGWVASFDWFIKPESVTKVLEGKYDNRAKVQAGRQQRIGPDHPDYYNRVAAMRES